MTLPHGWTTRSYADLGTWYGGGTPSKSNPRFWENGHVPWLSPKDMGDDVLRSVQLHVTEAAVEGSAVRRVPSTAVAVVVRSGILERTLPVALVPFETTLNQDMKAVVPTPDVDARWLAWGLRRAAPQLLRDCRKTGTTVASIEMARWYAQRMPVPPLRDQVQTVELLEGHLSRLDNGLSNLVLAQHRLVRCRQGLVLEAVLGRSLSSSPHQYPAGAALGAAVEPAFPLPTGWSWRKWREVGQSSNGKAFPSSDYASQGVKLLRPGNLGPDGKVRWPEAATRYMPPRYREETAHLLLRPGDVVVNLTAQSLKDDFLGRVCLVGDGDEALLNQRLARLRTDQLIPEYLLLVLQSQLFRTYVASLNKGSLIQHMFTKQIEEFWLPVPPLGTQGTLVEALQQRLDVLSRTTEVAEATTRRHTALRRALLVSAFSGRLTAQTKADELLETSRV